MKDKVYSVRIDDEDRQFLIDLSKKLLKEGNISWAIRYCIKTANKKGIKKQRK